MRKIGVFDSGIGGLTVMKSLLEHKLFEEIIYYGDTARVPYGVKDANTIIRYALEAVEFFKNFDIDLLVVACNTVSAYALEAMQESAPFDVVGVVEPGILALQKSQTNLDDPILILGTKATVASKAYEKRLHALGYTRTTALATGLFVPIVEDQLTDTPILTSTIEHYFQGLTPPASIILGCTHFPLITQPISAYFDHQARLIHSGDAIVEYLEQTYTFSRRFEVTQMKFFASENPDSLKAVARRWLGL
ncbi:MAG: glutamate racemase [Sulfurovum sp. PC08-66]|nr:MAG: glutamate racemase [Sulfurovum sp. PC08-66]KIM12477.1 MAG: glutamate racemase [Sulfuricurvum sp. PC08-66]